MKQCPQCKKDGEGPKPLSDFCRGTNADGLQSWCREHTRKYNRGYAKANPEKNREKGREYRAKNPSGYRKIGVRTNLKCKYGLSEAQFASMFDAQHGECAICDTKLISQLDPSRVLPGKGAENAVARVDHCHKTKVVRGLLCFSCNVGLGKFQDSEKVLMSAVRYLRATSSNRAYAPATKAPRAQHVTLQGERGPASRDPDRTQAGVRRRVDELSPF